MARGSHDSGTRLDCLDSVHHLTGSIKATMNDLPENIETADERADIMRDHVVRTFRERYGEQWGRDPDLILRFSLDAEHLLEMVEGAHLIGDVETGNGEVCLRVWVDHPLRDLMSADQLAYDIFARLSEDLFFAERRFDKRSVSYPFVTGTPRGGYIGSLVLSGPHAADFADQFQRTLTGGRGYQA